MQLKTILNFVHPLKSFVYAEDRFVALPAGRGPCIEVVVAPRKNGLVLCSGCGKPGSLYDHGSQRRFDFVPLYSIPC